MVELEYVDWLSCETVRRVLKNQAQALAEPQWVIPSKADGEFVWRTQVILTQEAAVWEQARNSQGKAIDWRFTTADACINLKHLHPSIQSDRPPVCIDIFVNSVDLGL